ncbi:hypothetical protein Efla_001794 [Eimeria flavescens]
MSCGERPATPLRERTRTPDAPSLIEWPESDPESPQRPPPPPLSPASLAAFRAQWEELGRVARQLNTEIRPVIHADERQVAFEAEYARLHSLGYEFSLVSDDGPNGLQVIALEAPEGFPPELNSNEEDHPTTPISVHAFDSQEEIDYEEQLANRFFCP